MFSENKRFFADGVLTGEGILLSLNDAFLLTGDEEPGLYWRLTDKTPYLFMVSCLLSAH